MTTIVKPICYECKHLIRQPGTSKAEYPFRCAAFPEGIPQPILLSQADHRKPFDGDNGIQFEARDKHGEAYAAHVFGGNLLKVVQPHE